MTSVVFQDPENFIFSVLFYLQLEIHQDDEKLTVEATGISGSGCGGGTSGQVHP